MKIMIWKNHSEVKNEDKTLLTVDLKKKNYLSIAWTEYLEIQQKEHSDVC